MKKYFTIIATLPLLLLVVLNACKKDIDVLVNRPPVADAGADLVTVLPKDSVLLDGSASSDRDGRVTRYHWKKVAGPDSYGFDYEDAARTMVRSLKVGVYLFELRVADNNNALGYDTVQVTVNISNGGANYPPVANAGPDQIVKLPANSCTLNGRGSYDPDGSILSYHWTKVAGPSSSTLVTPDAVSTQVTYLAEGAYRFELMVTDNAGATARDTVQIAVQNQSAGNCDISTRARVDGHLNQVGTLSEPRLPAVGAAGGKIVFAGGFNFRGATVPDVSAAVDIYDLQSGSWTTAQLSQARGSVAAVSLGNKIYFAGGSKLSASVDVAYDNVDIYDASTNTWSVAHLSTPRAEIATAVVGSKILFAGGTPNWWQGSSRVDIYDTATKQWSIAELSQEKIYVGAATVGEKVYFAGGETLAQAYESVDIYDNATGHWSRSDLTQLIGGVRGVADDGVIYWVGSTFSGNVATGGVEMWNTLVNHITFSCLSFPRYTGYPRVESAPVVSGNEVVIFGWSLEQGSATKFDLYNTQTRAWSIGSMDLAIAGAATIYVNDKIYMAGGNTLGTQSTDKVYTLSWN